MKQQWMPFVHIGSLAVLLTLTACSNPADSVNEAEVTSAKTIPDSNLGGNKFISSATSKLGFVGSKVTGSHEGGFETFSAVIYVEDGVPVGHGTSVDIDMDSTWSDSEKLTGHLKNADFFDVPAFPEASFTSTAIQKTEEAYMVTGNLNLHGVTKSITFPAEIDVSETEVKVRAEFYIKRFDFDIKYPGRADNLIRDEVVIKLNIVAVPS